MIEQKCYTFSEEEVMQILGDYIAKINDIEFDEFESDISYDFDAEDGNGLEIRILI